MGSIFYNNDIIGEIRHQKIRHQPSSIFMLVAKQVTTDKELQQILDLQKQNLRGVKSAIEEKEQGFVTVTHSMQKLQQLHSYEPSIIVKENDALAGYALVMPVECSKIIPELASLFEGLENLDYKGKSFSRYRYYVMGQVCVAEAYRGLGVFDLLYQKTQRSSFNYIRFCNNRSSHPQYAFYACT